MKKSEASKETQKTASAEKKVKKDRPGVRARRKKKTHRILIWIGMILSILLVVSGVLLVALARWVFATWNGLKMDEVIYHINAPIEGTGGDMIASGIVNCVIPAGLAGLFYTAALLIYRRRRRVRKYLVRLGAVCGALMIVLTLIFSWNRLDIGTYISNELNASSFIEDHYADPAKVNITFPEKKRNVIYIYLESMEMTYSDAMNGGAFNRNVIPELTALGEANEDFSGSDPLLNGADVLPGSTYTMAAMFTQTTGLPLKVDLSDTFTDARGSFNKMNTQDSFFAGVTALGDVLKEQGYNQVLMLGSNATFGGRRLYFSQHGDYEIDDYEWAIDQGLIPENYYVFWGYEDAKLFTYAKDRLLDLAAQDKPFNFTMLTVDTHFEDGYYCDLCTDSFRGNQYANVMACSSRQVADFVNWAKEQDFYEDTTIIIAGDHLTMDTDFCQNVGENYDRRTFNVWINAAAEPADPERKRSYSTLDCFPTTLAAMGCQIEGERLGLGTNLFSSEDTLMEQYGYEELADELSRKSEFMDKLADLDLYSEELADAQGLSPSASLAIAEIDDTAESCAVAVNNIDNVFEKIKSVEIDAWDFQHPDKVSTTVLHEAEEGVYRGSVDLRDLHCKNAELRVCIVGKSGTRYEAAEMTGDLTLKTNNIYKYLYKLSQNRQYTIFVTIRDDGTRMLDENIMTGLHNLGLTRNLEGHYRWSYYGIITPLEVTEDLSMAEIGDSGTMSDGVSYSILSQGGLSGAGGGAGRYLTCSVKINGVEYAVQRIGLNFVIYDTDAHRVVDSVEFNTYDGLGALRIDISNEAMGIEEE